jgi:MFS family permease
MGNFLRSTLRKFNLIRWFANPNIPPSVNKKNFLNVQADAFGVGLANAASPFLPVFLTRLGASNLQVSLLSSMPALTGLLLSIPAGRILQRKKDIVPWFSSARLLVVLSYTMTGAITFLLPENYSIIAILVIWAIATLPQTIVSICFSVVMNAVAGPENRYELMTRRWSILGFTSSVTVIAVGQILDLIHFPINYQLVFIGLSIGGLISFFFSSHIELPENIFEPVKREYGILRGAFDYAKLIYADKPFISFIWKRTIFLAGAAMAAPIFPLYFVREIHASDAWIGIISTAQSALLIIGYSLWSRITKRHGARQALILSTLGLSLYPFLTAFTDQVWVITVFAGLSGIFQAGIDLIFFDELMKSIPIKYSATFVSVSQSLQYFSAVISPIIGSLLANYIGLSGALIVSAAIRLIGFLCFSLAKPSST